MASSRENIQQSMILIVVTALVVMLREYVKYGLNCLAALHHKLSGLLAMIFSGSHWGAIIRQTLAMSLVPIALSAVLAVGYWLVKKQAFPWFKCVMWLLWVSLMTLLVYHGG